MARKKSAVSSTPRRHSERVEKQMKLKEHQKAAAQPSKPKRFRRPRQTKGCHLLTLPGELRNRIYELAVLEDEPIHITSKGPGQPALIRTCRRIRREAGTLFYGSNEFNLMIEGYNGADFVHFSRQARKFEVPGARQDVHFLFDRTCNWEKLVAWIKAHHMEAASIPDWSEPLNKNNRVAAGAFQLASKCGFWSWERKEEVLGMLYETLRGTNSPWVRLDDRVYY